MAYRKGLDNFVSPEVYQLVVATFRSWILVLLLPPAIYLLQKKMSQSLGHASTRE
jgi:hypothetical protein